MSKQCSYMIKTKAFNLMFYLFFKNQRKHILLFFLSEYSRRIRPGPGSRICKTRWGPAGYPGRSRPCLHHSCLLSIASHDCSVQCYILTIFLVERLDFIMRKYAIGNLLGFYLLSLSNLTGLWHGSYFYQRISPDPVRRFLELLGNIAIFCWGFHA